MKVLFTLLFLVSFSTDSFSASIIYGFSSVMLPNEIQEFVYRGGIESEKIYQNGFKNLYLATGHEKESFVKPSWIKEIFSKSPDNVFKYLT